MTDGRHFCRPAWARGESVNEELLEDETEVNRPLRIFVERRQLDEANELFASGVEV